MNWTVSSRNSKSLKVDLTESGGSPANDDTDDLRTENEQLEKEVANLKEQLKEKNRILGTEVRVFEAKLKASEDEKESATERLKVITKRLAQNSVFLFKLLL